MPDGLAHQKIYKLFAIDLMAIVIINYNTCMLKKIMKFSGRLLICFMFAVCMVTGVVPVIPKRKEQFDIEIKAENAAIKSANTASFTQSEVKS